MKILIVRFSSIGDIVLTTPIIRCVKEQLDDATIHFLTKASFQNLLVDNPHLSKIYTINHSINEVVNQLKKEKYDYVIDLHKNIRTFALKRKLGVKNNSFRKLNFKKWLFVNFKKVRMPNLHIVDRYFEAVTFLGVTNDGLPCELHLQKEHFVHVEQEFGVVPKNYVAVAVGAKFATKTLPPKKLARIINQIEQPTVLLGGDGDTQRGKEILSYLTESKQKETHSAIAKYNIMQTASVVAQSSKILTHDTGLMHIASCFSIPIVSVWGNTVPELGMYPYYPEDKTLYSIHQVENLSCRPCSKIGHQECPKKHFKCMKLQDEKAIAEDVGGNEAQ